MQQAWSSGELCGVARAFPRCAGLGAAAGPACVVYSATSKRPYCIPLAATLAPCTEAGWVAGAAFTCSVPVECALHLVAGDQDAHNVGPGGVEGEWVGGQSPERTVGFTQQPCDGCALMLPEGQGVGELDVKNLLSLGAVNA